MNKFLASTAIATILAFPAVAEQTDISQTVDALQKALNTIDIADDATDVSQAGVNAANIISIDSEHLDDVLQEAQSGTKQVAKNDFDTDGLNSNHAILTDISQAGTNVLNSVDMTSKNSGSFDINRLGQKAVGVKQKADNDIDIRVGTSTNVEQAATNVMNMAAMDDLQENAGGIDLKQKVKRSKQKAENELDIDLGAENTAQDAVNVMNLAEIEDDLKGDSLQKVTKSSQSAMNRMLDTEIGAEVVNLMQSAVNVANSLDVGGSSPNTGGSAHGASISQYYADNSGQTASNFVKFSTEGITGSAPKPSGKLVMDQSALNAINLATVTNVGWTVSQTAYDVDQDASNKALNQHGGIDADVTDFDQSATNVANILSAGTLPDIVGMTEVSQTFAGAQLSTNGMIGADDLTDVTQSATNVINSVSGL